jgi:hypothetical protein
MTSLFRNAEDPVPSASGNQGKNFAQRLSNYSWASQWKDGSANNDNESAPGVTLDTDNDGFADWLESDQGTDPNDNQSVPSKLTTSLYKSLKGRDNDGDGIPNAEEDSVKTNFNVADSDQDGVNDGAELLSGSDPSEFGYTEIDADGDGLSDSFEIYEGTNPKNGDTDQDGLRDDHEIALGANPFNNDTDGDGILDGKEFAQGSDPTKAD